jgi:hypothetical protein
MTLNDRVRGLDQSTRNSVLTWTLTNGVVSDVRCVDRSEANGDYWTHLDLLIYHFGEENFVAGQWETSDEQWAGLLEGLTLISICITNDD